MLKIIVFDGGCGGETVADFLADELGVIEVIKVIDRNHGSYENKSQVEICSLAERALKPYIDRVDLIVFGGYTVSLALETLHAKYPHQKFVGLGINYHRILKSNPYPFKITALMQETLLDSPLRDELRDNLPFSTLAIPDCSGWSTLADQDQLSTDIIQKDLSPYFALQPVKRIQKQESSTKPQTLLDTIFREKYYSAGQTQLVKPSPAPPATNTPDRRLISSDTVLILNTCLWSLKREIEDVFGYKVRVMDFRQKLLHDVCIGLDLLGLDGKRSK